MRSLLATSLLLGLAACGSGPLPSSGRCGNAGVEVENELWKHVPEGSPLTPRNNPPASGPHYPIWSTYRIHDEVVARGYWIHNLEHGALVLLYRPDAPAQVIAELKAAYQALPVDPQCGTHRRALLTPDPLLATPVAAVVADWVIAADRLDAQAVRALADRCRGKGPENVCGDGFEPTPVPDAGSGDAL